MYFRMHSYLIHSLLLVFYSIATLVGCSKNHEEEAQPKIELKKSHRSTGVAADADRENQRKVGDPKVYRGVVYISKIDSSSHLALEGENGEVYFIIGDKQFELSNLKNRKVEVLGYVHRKKSEMGVRDSLEVIHYEIIHGEGD
ncbi:MAG: hypothetical protein ACE5HO_02285 [bacterium]